MERQARESLSSVGRRGAPLRNHLQPGSIMVNSRKDCRLVIWVHSRHRIIFGAGEYYEVDRTQTRVQNRPVHTKKSFGPCSICQGNLEWPPRNLRLGKCLVLAPFFLKLDCLSLSPFEFRKIIIYRGNKIILSRGDEKTTFYDRSVVFVVFADPW